MGKGFEEVCRILLHELSLQNKFSDQFQDIHKYFATRKAEKASEIDIIAPGLNQQVLLIGECEWHEKPPDKKAIRETHEKYQRFRGELHKKYVNKFKRTEVALFSRRKVTDETIMNLTDELRYIHLVALSTLEKWVEMPLNPSTKLL